MKAMWKGAVLAESDDAIEVEGSLYFPPTSVRKEHLRESDHCSTCPWKGEASYYDVVVGGEVNRDAAWCYLDPKPAAKNIKGHIAFCKMVELLP